MKTHFIAKPTRPTPAHWPFKNQPARPASKSFAHRHERRKLREQLRHVDWALAGED